VGLGVGLGVGLLCAVIGGMQAAAAPQENKARISVAATIVAAPATLTPLPIQVGPPEVIPRNSFLRLRGMPLAASLTEGYAIGPGFWAIPLIALPTLKANVPVGAAGHSELIITLVDTEGTSLAEAKTTLVVETAAPKALPQEPLSGPPPAGALAPPPAVRAESYHANLGAHHARELSPEERSSAEKLVALGQRYLDQGNIEIARQFFQRAANAGLAEGATRLAATYDPDELARMGAQGVVADRAQALRWYERARELGAPDTGALPAKPSRDER
jgi:hypothetical protein